MASQVDGATAPAPYSTPWQLRPAAPARVLRLDTSLASYQNADGANGTTLVPILLASVRVGKSAAVLGRIGLVQNDPPVGESVTVPTNLVLGGMYAPRVGGDWRMGLYLLTALPTAGGGGNDPDPADAIAIRSGVPARSAMDNAMFAANDFVLFPGIDLAWVRGGWTVQGEITILELWRIRGDEVQADVRKTNFTTGLHVGCFPAKSVSLGGELRYQRWLSTPAAVKANPHSRDTATVAFGSRFHLKTSQTSWFRPGLSVTVPLDKTMTDADYLILQVDLPYFF
ncbi:MAG: hypothetical protein SGI90_07140 [Candidatus Eisenbacteria bacterium]|nr:hypothetical protein [Candidatus Eisenbacteria bacterium]